jgi:hypothetical protein
MDSGTAVFRIAGEEKRPTYVPESRAVEVIAAGGVALTLLGRRRFPAERAVLRAIARGRRR